MDGDNIKKRPIHLGLGGAATIQPTFTGGMEWFVDYASRSHAYGVDGRLVMMNTHTESWTDWEMHPNGAEVVLCVEGSITMHQEYPDGREVTQTLKSSEYLINEPGVWHTADIEDEATVLFITAGAGTEGRPR